MSGETGKYASFEFSNGQKAKLTIAANDTALPPANKLCANAAPTANAGPDQNVNTGSVVTLDGSGSSDANNDTLTYTWTIVNKPSGSSVTISDPSSAKPTFTAETDGSYVVQLVVDDGSLQSAANMVAIISVKQNENMSVSPTMIIYLLN